jgi:hypothetical protein
MRRVLKAVLAIALQQVLPIAAQQVTLEDFSVMRKSTDGRTLWFGTYPAGGDDGSGSMSTCNNNEDGLNPQPLVNNLWTCTASPKGSGPVPNGVAFWLNDITPAGYTFPNGYLQHWILRGTWTPSINRMRYQYKCANSIASPAPGGNNVEFGTYTRSPSDPNPSQSGQGTHYYHASASPVYAGQWVYVEYNRVPEHRVADYGGANYPEDPEFVIPLGGYPAHYFDGMTHFYWAGAYIDNNTLYYGTTCSFTNWTLDTVPAGADNWLHSITATYNPNEFGQGNGAYKITWQAPKQAPSGITYDVRYSLRSMRANGFSAGTPAGSVTSPSGTSDTSTIYTSPQLPQTATRFFAFRPHMQIIGVTQTAPIIVTPIVDSNLRTSDRVVVSGVNGGSHAANGTWTVTVNPRPLFRISDNSLTRIVALNGIAMATTASPHGLKAGQLIYLSNSYREGLNSYGQPQLITSVPSPTTFRFAITSADLTYDSSNSPSMFVLALDSYSLNGSDGSGAPAYIANTGTAVATSETSNFAEIQFPGTVTAPNPCDINGDGIVNTIDVSLMVDQALGRTACANDIDVDGKCDVVDVQRVIDAANGAACRTGS